MMNKYSTDTLILLIFTLNVLSLVFLGDNSPLLGLMNKLLSIVGLSWLINYYYRTLKSNDRSGDIDLTQGDRLILLWEDEFFGMTSA